ncbi:MAG: EF-hand domain-containing protein [Stellaceae bacterium]
MKQLLFAASALALAVGLSASAFAQTSVAECTAIFEKADTNHDGWIDGDEVTPYIGAMKKAGLIALDANHDDKLNADEFQAACLKGAFNGLPQLYSAPKGLKVK